MTEPNNTILPGSGVVPVLPVPLMSKDSAGIEPMLPLEAMDGQPPPCPSLPVQPTPSFSSQYTGSPLGMLAFCRFNQ